MCTSYKENLFPIDEIHMETWDMKILKSNMKDMDRGRKAKRSFIMILSVLWWDMTIHAYDLI